MCLLKWLLKQLGGYPHSKLARRNRERGLSKAYVLRTRVVLKSSCFVQEEVVKIFKSLSICVVNNPLAMLYITIDGTLPSNYLLSRLSTWSSWSRRSCCTLLKYLVSIVHNIMKPRVTMWTLFVVVLILKVISKRQNSTRLISW